jgi:hypothetical protein
MAKSPAHRVMQAPHRSRNFVDILESRQLLTASVPFLGTPFVPGQLIPAVQYDKGGEGIAYHDTTAANLGGNTYRKGDAVDIQTGGSQGKVVSYAVATEWLNYTINVPAAGQYMLQASVANTAAGGAFDAEFGAALSNLTGGCAVPNTGSWTKYATFKSAAFSLPAGQMVMRIHLDQNASSNGVANFDWFKLVAASAPVDTPYLSPFGINQIIPAAQYDKGGEGISYHDTTAGNQGGDNYRPGDGVDIQKGGATGNVVAYAVAGEWLQYTLNVPATGQYVLAASVANTGTGGAFEAQAGGVNLSGLVFVPNTGSWTTYATVQSTPIALPAGQVILRIALERNATSNGVADFDSFRIIPAQSALETTVGNTLRSANASAVTGAYLRVVDGPILADVNGEQKFEPASAIKTVAAVTALQAVQAGKASLKETITYYFDPADPTNVLVNPDAYAHKPANALTTTLQNAIAGMLQQSDNRMTDAIELRFGLPAINATAAKVGMTSTIWTQTLGSGIPGNYMTLADADLLYDKVLDSSILNSTYSALFQNLIENQTNFGLSRWLPVIHQEAASVLGVAVGSTAEVNLTNTFAAHMLWGSKAGSYYLPINATTQQAIRSHTGYLVLPTMVGKVMQQVEYSYGVFMDKAVIPIVAGNADNPASDKIENALLVSTQELARGIIHAALLTFV